MEEPHAEGDISTSDANDADAEDTADEIDTAVQEPIVVHAIQRTTTAQAIAKPKIVSVPKRGPPPMLPPRNPTRSGPLVINAEPRASGEMDGANETPTEAFPRHDSWETKDEKSADKENTKPEAVTAEEKHGLQEVSGRLDDVDLSTDETPDEKRDPWSKVRDMRADSDSQKSLDIPGGFQSFPTTPEEADKPVKA